MSALEWPAARRRAGGAAAAVARRGGGQTRCPAQGARRLAGVRRSPGPVTVIVPAYNEGENIEATVRSAVASTHPVEIIVVDDGSTDGTADLVEGLGLPNVRVIRQTERGKAAALNTGIAAASHDIMVLVDGDTVFEPDTVAELVQPFADPASVRSRATCKVANREGCWRDCNTSNTSSGSISTDVCTRSWVRCRPYPVRVARTDFGAASGRRYQRPDPRRGHRPRHQRRTGRLARGVTGESGDVDGGPDHLRQLWRQRFRWTFGTCRRCGNTGTPSSSGVPGLGWAGSALTWRVPDPAAAVRPGGRRLPRLRGAVPRSVDHGAHLG